MKRNELIHIIRAATSIIQSESVLVIGSQSILGSFSDSQLPDAATRSIEADILPPNNHAGALSDLIDGTIGEFSAFHETFGIYAQGVDESTAILPSGWEDRLIELKDPSLEAAVGFCLDPLDLCIAKLLAHREKDIEFVGALLLSGIVKSVDLLDRLELVDEKYSSNIEVAKDYLK